MTTARVLIVDDERNIRLTLKGALEGVGLEADAVCRGEEALQKLAEKNFDAMILDLRLPGMDGLSVLSQVLERHEGLKVIIVTAYGTVDAVIEAMKLGAVDFLQKPFEPLEVREILARVLSRPEGGSTALSYEDYVHQARKSVESKRYSSAFVYAHKAVFMNADRPEAFNLLGGLYEVRDQRKEAITYYRTAREIDPAYVPAQQNLERASARPYSKFGIAWG
jgi:DNA-binding NtrC family response regulator